ncbi:MAG: squalene/phytoene synthase family protein [Chloroflexota bacterium]
MSLQQPTPTAWEAPLLDWAYTALDSQRPAVRVKADRDALAAAYGFCREMTRFHSRTFYIASGLLPPAKKRAVRALYAFCRLTDDLVDRPVGDEQTGADWRLIEIDDRRPALDDWRSLTLDSHPPPDEPVALAWADTRAHYHIPVGYAEQLIEGVARDVDQFRYETFDDLAAYAYGVASTVGLMAMHIIGFASDQALPYAVKLGVALQMTNILRDVGEDWQAGRLYLPQEELAAFHLTEGDIGRGQPHARWRDFMRFQIERTRRLYDEAEPGIAMLNPDGRFAISAAADLYRAILTDIEAHDYDVFSRRAHVGAVGKLARLPRIWHKSRTG